MNRRVKILKRIVLFAVVMILAMMPIGTTEASEPSVFSMSPANGSLINDKYTIIQMDFSDSDGIARYGYSIKVNEKLISSSLRYTDGYWEYDSCGGSYWVIKSYNRAQIYSSKILLDDGLQNVEVTVRDSKGNILTKQWSFDVAVKPSFSEMYPANLSNTADNKKVSIRVTDNGSIDPSSIELRVDGNEADHQYDSQKGIITFISSEGLQGGEHTAEVYAKDMKGNEGSKTWKFNVVTKGPNITFINTPANVESASTSFTAKITSDVKLSNYLTVKINGEIVPASMQFKGHWESDSCSQWYVIDSYREATVTGRAVNLQDGSNVLEVEVKDSLGNISSKQWEYMVSAKPVIAPMLPTGNILTSDDRTISIKVTDNSAIDPKSIVMKIDGNRVPHNYDEISGVVSYTIDDNPKAQMLSSESFSSKFSLSSIMNKVISMGLIRPFGFSGDILAFASPSNFLLAEGEHIVEVTVADINGNVSIASYSFTLASVGPNMTFAGNETTYNVTSPTLVVDVSSTVNLMNYAVVKVDGNVISTDFTYKGHWESDSCGSWYVVDSYKEATVSSQPLNLKDGFHTLEVTTKDSAGNTSTMQWTFNVLVKPAFSGMYPTGGSTTKDNSLVSVKVSDNDGIDPSSIVLLVDGNLANHDFNSSTGMVTYSPIPALLDGNHVVNISATDLAGNQSSISWIYSIYTLPPILTFADAGKVYTTKSPVLEVIETSGIDLAQYSVVKIDGNAVSPTTFTYKGHWVYDSCGNSFWVVDSRKEATISYQASGLAEGQHTLEVTGKDIVGNVVTKQWIFYVNSIPSVIEVQASNYGMTEGSPVTITVVRTGGTGGPSAVNYGTLNGSAVSGSDYTTNSGLLEFAPGETIKTITIEGLDDSTYEGIENFSFSLNAPVGASLGPPANALVTITDNDPMPEVHFASAGYSLMEGGTASITVTLSEALGCIAEVNYSLISGTATGGTDFLATSGTISFEPGEVVKSFIVTGLNDDLYEGDEMAALELSTPYNAVLGTQRSAVLTVVDTDLPPEFQFNAVSYSGAEGSSVVVEVLRTGALGGTSAVDYLTTDGTATQAEDYAATAGTLTFEPGENIKNFTITGIDDDVFEGTESFSVALSNPDSAVLGAQVTAQVNISDNDTAPIIEINNGSYLVLEGSSVLLNVYRLGAAGGVSTVDYVTAQGTATEGQDYTPVVGTLTFAKGETVKTITINLLEDDLFESVEQMEVVLANPGSATLSVSERARISIADNDPVPQIEFTMATYTTGEGTDAVISLYLTGATSLSASVDYTTAEGTAEAGIDYTSTAGTVTFAPGETVKSFTVPILDDEFFETEESLDLSLQNPINASLGSRVNAKLLITSDDPPPTIQFGASDYGGIEGTSIAVEVIRSGDLSVASSVDYQFTDGSAIAGLDYNGLAGSINFSPGESLKVLTVQLSDDAFYEDGEDFYLNLLNPSIALIGAHNSTHLLIADNDEAPQISLDAAAFNVEEGGSIAVNLVRTGAVGGLSSVSYTLTGGTASPSADYLVQSGTFDFAPGESGKVILVNTVDDDLYEGDETLHINLNDPLSAQLGNNSSAILTIADNERSLVKFGSGNYYAEEGNSALVVVERIGDLSGTTNVNYAVTGGTAIAGTDYEVVSGSLTFNPGESTKNITVTTVNDSKGEGGESIYLELTDVVGSTIKGGGAVSRVTITIVDDDVPSGNLMGLQFDTPSFVAVPVGQTKDVILYGEYQEGSKADITEAADWTSSHPAVATVEPGLITGRGVGTTIISANFGGYKKQVTVVVR